jgi:DNA gyrase subunit A
MYRFKTLRRRASFQLTKLRNRLHITEGLLIALGRIDDIINLLKSSKDQSQARQTLTSDVFGLSPEQVSLRRRTGFLCVRVFVPNHYL